MTESNSVPKLMHIVHIRYCDIICILSQFNKSRLWSHPMLLPIPKQCFLHLSVKQDDIFLITEHRLTLFSNQTPGAQICGTIRKLVILISVKQRKSGGTYPNLTTNSQAHTSNAGLLLLPAGPQIKCIFLTYTVWNSWLQWLNTGYEKSGVGGCLFSFSASSPCLRIHVFIIAVSESVHLSNRNFAPS